MTMDDMRPSPARVQEALEQAAQRVAKLKVKQRALRRQQVVVDQQVREARKALKVLVRDLTWPEGVTLPGRTTLFEEEA